MSDFMDKELNRVEEDLIEFVSRYRNRTVQEIKEIYIRTRNKFYFSSERYRTLCLDIHELHRLFYDDVDESELIDTYRQHSVMHLFRHISYSFDYYPKWKYNIKKHPIRDIMHLFVEYKTKNNIRLEKRSPFDRYKKIANKLMSRIDNNPSVIDYGCGLGYISYELGKLNDAAKITLVDIESLVLEFVVFRFKKNRIITYPIPIKKDNLYPVLPQHNICIAQNIMEHIKTPLLVYKNIYDSMVIGGILYGNFDDKEQEMLHVSSNMRELRSHISKNYRRIDKDTYIKVN
jgi:2-polyprenyl-3-methyl-5-hydroxy-6-metoxy-1,4-benzoquinol methylase